MLRVRPGSRVGIRGENLAAGRLQQNVVKCETFRDLISGIMDYFHYRVPKNFTGCPDRILKLLL